MSTSALENQLCSVTLLGNLVAKPDIRYLTNPVVAVTDIVLATNSKWLDKASNSYKEWTSFHHVRVVGALVEETLLYANKGDVLLVHGTLINNKTSPKELVNASFIQTFDKGYIQAINQIHCSGILLDPVQCVLTKQNKEFAQVRISITYQAYSASKQKFQKLTIERQLHFWGKQARYISEHSKVGDNLVIEGKLNYLSTVDKSQFIHGTKVQLIKKQ